MPDQVAHLLRLELHAEAALFPVGQGKPLAREALDQSLLLARMDLEQAEVADQLVQVVRCGNDGQHRALGMEDAPELRRVTRSEDVEHGQGPPGRQAAAPA
jgi:hypothetical protein